MVNRSKGGYRRYTQDHWISSMKMPLFPLSVVLFPGMMLPLQIFEPRYVEMINQCLENEVPFGVVLIKEGNEVGGPAVPYEICTAARITRVERKAYGRMDNVVVGTRRFRIEDLHDDLAYPSAEVSHYPLLNGDTRLAAEQAQKVRPKIVRYVELLTQATGVQLQLDQLPEDPTRLAFLTAIALQVKPEDKQRVLVQVGVPEMLDMANYLLGRELQLLQHMVDTQSVVESLTSGPTGSLFDN